VEKEPIEKANNNEKEKKKKLIETEHKPRRLQTALAPLFLVKGTFVFVRTGQNRIKSTGYG
jgi:hypothetical protein